MVLRYSNRWHICRLNILVTLVQWRNYRSNFRGGGETRCAPLFHFVSCSLKWGAPGGGGGHRPRLGGGRRAARAPHSYATALVIEMVDQRGLGIIDSPFLGGDCLCVP